MREGGGGRADQKANIDMCSAGACGVHTRYNWGRLAGDCNHVDAASGDHRWTCSNGRMYNPQKCSELSAGRCGAVRCLYTVSWHLHHTHTESGRAFSA